MFKVG